MPRIGWRWGASIRLCGGCRRGRSGSGTSSRGGWSGRGRRSVGRLHRRHGLLLRRRGTGWSFGRLPSGRLRRSFAGFRLGLYRLGQQDRIPAHDYRLAACGFLVQDSSVRSLKPNDAGEKRAYEKQTLNILHWYRPRLSHCWEQSGARDGVSSEAELQIRQDWRPQGDGRHDLAGRTLALQGLCRWHRGTRCSRRGTG